MQLTASHSKIMVSADGTGIVSQAGGLLLIRTLRATGLDHGLGTALERWRPARAVHSSGKIITDLAVAVALGGDCLADVAILRAQPELAGPVASDPVVSRLVTRLAADAPRALKAIRAARAAARQRAWALAGDAAPGAARGLVTVDIDATVVTSGSEKEQAMPTWKKTYGHHPPRNAVIIEILALERFCSATSVNAGLPPESWIHQALCGMRRPTGCM